MDDLAAILGMSKKTIYNVFSDKNSLFLDMVDYLFDTIKESEQKIVKDTSLSTIEKIRHILGVMPESYKEIDFEQLYLLKDKYPDIYRKVEKRLENCNKNIKVAVMGCVVNGPGEAREADIGIAGGNGEGLIFKKGEIIKKVKEEDLIEELMREIENL